VNSPLNLYEGIVIKQSEIQFAINQHHECIKLLDSGYVTEATHEYTDVEGNVIYYKVRLKNSETNDKWIRPVHFDGTEWVWKEPAFKKFKPLYNLHDIVSNPEATIWICEGEKSVDHINKFFKKLNIYGANIATTTGGAGSANSVDWSILANHKIIIWPDNDEAGTNYCNAVIDKLREFNACISIVDIAQLALPEKGDVVDWLLQNQNTDFDDINTLPMIIDDIEQKKSLFDLMLSAKNLMQLDLPELEYIVFPFISVQSLIMVYAKRGIGKTWFSLQLAISVALGKPFFAWDVPKPRSVLFIDGEMPLSSLQYRLKYLCVDKFPELLNILPSEILWRNGQSLNLNDEADLIAIDRFLDKLKSTGQAPELIVIDNLSSMTAGTDENGNSEMDAVLRWQLKLRSQGYSVLIVHHAGKNGDQRGGSRREDFLDTSIKLTVASNPAGEGKEIGACFNIEFVKTRGLRPNPDALKVELWQDEQGFAKWKTEGADILPAYYETLRLIRDCEPKTQAEIAKMLHISASAVSQQLKAARDKGLLEKNKLLLTNKGKAEIDKLFEDYSTSL